ncbi:MULTISPECIES: hypothetical protein [unclassified Clostridium]|uniref:hypothetical protein n=1 Tax=Clostridium TaxID=1485 RepID=UPI001C8CDFF6|nr:MULTISPECIES: hypothetical protein [unclassified Clostridium]MBX9138401.1 hypothetical protein [Clostridium sp. K12(2020)]MBX9145106.1 hypothetical protein [Clostridium sp. K13]MDU2290403.1 hypothetical protein [Clostridium celatum]
MKIRNNYKFIINSFIIIFLTTLAVYLFVDLKLSQNDLQLSLIWIYTTLFTVSLILIFIILIIIYFMRILLKKKNCYGRLIRRAGVIVVIMIISSVIITKEHNRYHHIINSNWELNLPTNYEEIYYKDSGPSFNGDGERYSIFQYENLDEINNLIEWQEKNSSIEINMISVLRRLEVPEEYYPDFKTNFKYYYSIKEDNSKIHMILDSNLNKTYTVEEIF